MSMLIRFSPWVVFVGLTEAAGWRLGLIAGLVVSLMITLLSSPPKIGVLDAGQLSFFVAFSVFAFLRPTSELQHHMSNVSMAWFAVVAVLSLLAGHPFTLDFAGDEITPEIAASELYRKIHNTITAVWAACFAAIAAAGFIATASDRPSIATTATVVGLIIAIVFTKRYPDRAVAHAMGDRQPVHA